MRTSTVELITFVLSDFDTLSMPLIHDFFDQWGIWQQLCHVYLELTLIVCVAVLPAAS